jgi:transposase
LTGIAAVNKDMYIDILRLLKGAVGRKRRETWRINSWFIFHDNAPAHWSVLVKDFLAKNNVTTLENPPHPSDMAPNDFNLFAQLKSALKGRRFCDAADVIKNTAKMLKRGFFTQ